MNKILGFLIYLALGAFASGLEVKTMFIDQPPKSELKGGVFSGLAIDILHGIEKVDPQLHFLNISKAVTPVARVEKALEDGDIDVYVGFSKNAERVAKFNFATTLFQSSNVFVAAAGETATFKTLDEFKALNKDATVLTVSNSAAAQFLKKQGIKSTTVWLRSQEPSTNCWPAGQGSFLFSTWRLLLTSTTQDSKIRSNSTRRSPELTTSTSAFPRKRLLPSWMP